jgi:hypothetical protein
LCHITGSGARRCGTGGVRGSWGVGWNNGGLPAPIDAGLEQSIDGTLDVIAVLPLGPGAQMAALATTCRSARACEATLGVVMGIRSVAKFDTPLPGRVKSCPASHGNADPTPTI